MSKKHIPYDNQVFFFDKKTGEKFTKQGLVMLNDICHFKLKSEISGRKLLLSEYGMKLRFAETPDLGVKHISTPFRRLPK